MKDYYYILGIKRNSTISDIKAAYRKLSKKFHPDVNSGDKFFEERFKEIQEAHETLSNETKRSLYDFKLNNYKPDNSIKTETKNNETDIDFIKKEENLKKEGEKNKREEERLKREEERLKREKEKFEREKETRNKKRQKNLPMYLIIGISIFVIIIGINFKNNNPYIVPTKTELKKKEYTKESSKLVEQKLITKPTKSSLIDNKQEKKTINWVNGNWIGKICLLYTSRCV